MMQSMLRMLLPAVLGTTLTLALVASSAPVLGSSATTTDGGQVSAVFAGGCFWCMEPPFDELEGVVSTTSGFIGGHVSNPSYQQVVRGGTGHVEAVKVVYDPDVIDYAQLLDVFWRNVDPLDDGGQFCDRGEAYLTGIFVDDDEQRTLAEASLAALETSGRFDQPIVTPIRERSAFYPAEEYHQDYYRKNPVRYRFYRFNCGRDRRLNELWGD